eukprot:6313711-Alexandrium_andersonii.AAC.1
MCIRDSCFSRTPDAARSGCLCAFPQRLVPRLLMARLLCGLKEWLKKDRLMKANEGPPAGTAAAGPRG